MPILQAKVKAVGYAPLLMNNPQTVDRFNPYAKEMSKINAKKTARTDADYMRLRDIEMRSKIHWDDEIGIYAPATWLSAALATMSFKTAKISKAMIRASVFIVEDKLPLKYRSKGKVKQPQDIVKNDEFRHVMLLPQGGKRIAKAIPIFHDWSFAAKLEYDDTVLDFSQLQDILQKAGNYGGFGDFRPTFGRATMEITNE